MQLFQQQLQVFFRLCIAWQDQGAAVGRGQIHIDHLQGGELFQHGTWCQSRGQRTGALFQGDLQAIGHEGDQDMRFHTPVFLVVEGAQLQIAFQFLEGLFDFRQLHVVLPQRRRCFPREVGAQQVMAFAPLRLTQFGFVQGEAKTGLLILCCAGDVYRDQGIDGTGFFFGRAEFEQQLITAQCLPLQCLQPFP